MVATCFGSFIDSMRELTLLLFYKWKGEAFETLSDVKLMWVEAPTSASPLGFPTMAHALFWLQFSLAEVGKASITLLLIRGWSSSWGRLPSWECGTGCGWELWFGRLHLENMLETHPGFILKNIWLTRLKVPVVGWIVSCWNPNPDSTLILTHNQAVRK